MPLASFRSEDLTVAGSLAGNYLFICLGIKLGIFPTEVTSRALESSKLSGGSTLVTGAQSDWSITGLITLLVHASMAESKILRRH